MSFMGFVGGGGGGGGSTSPGGATTNVQFNSSGSFGGDSGFTYAGLGQATLSSGISTTNFSCLTITGTWNASGVTFDAPLLINIATTAFHSGSVLADFQAGGVSKVSITPAGRINTTTSTNTSINNASDCDIRLNGVAGNGMFGNTGSNGVGFGVGGSIGLIIGTAGAGCTVANNGLYAFAADGFVTSADTGMSRSAAAVVAFGNGTQGDASATFLAKTKAGAPTTSDVPAGCWILIRDTTNSTTKVYYNNAGTLQTVALA